MSAYIHGSLALEQKNDQFEKPVKPRQRKAPTPVQRSMPISEKLFYLFTVAVCVIVACVVIWRYAQIYEMNTRIHLIEQKITQLEAENNILKLEVNKLQSPPRLIEEAEKRGFVPVANKQITRVANLGDSRP